MYKLLTTKLKYGRGTVCSRIFSFKQALFHTVLMKQTIRIVI